MKRNLFIAVAVGAALLLPILSVARQAAEEITRDKILANGQEWKDKYDKYEPPAEMLNNLKGMIGSNLKVDVYLGLWCPDSRNNVPPFIKILDRLGVTIPVRYFGVPRKASKDVKYYVEEMDVQKVPTFIVYRDGKEIGRIVENPKVDMLTDLTAIFAK
jgi:hypothetical protein